MALLWMDGFDHFGNLGSSQATSEALVSAGYEVSSVGSDSVRVVTGRSPGTLAVRLRQHSTSGHSATLVREFETDADRVTFGFAYMASERSDVFDIEGLVTLEWPVGFKLNGVDGQSIPIRNIWYYIELVIDKVAEQLYLYVNNQLDITAPLPAEGKNMTTYTFRMGHVVSGYVPDIFGNENANLIQHLDDMFVTDGKGGEIRDRVGPIELTSRFPTSDVTADWAASIEDSELWEMVSNRPPIAGQYIMSNTKGAEATFESTDTLPTDAPVIALGLVARVRKTDIDRRALGLIWGDGANRIEVIDSDLSIYDKYSYGFFETPAPGQNWTKEVIESNSFGVKVRP